MQERIQQIVDESADVTEASRRLEEEARHCRELYDYLTSPALPKLCYAAVSQTYRDNRQKVWTAPNYTKGGNGHRVANHAQTLLDFPLPGGKRLRDATSQDLQEAAEFYAKQAADMSAKSAWLTRVGERVGGNKVADVMDADELDKLRRQEEAKAA